MPIKTIDGASLRARFPPPQSDKAPPDLKRAAPVVTERGMFASSAVLDLHLGEVEKLATNIELRPSTDESKLNKTEKAWLVVVRSRGYVWHGVQNISFKIGDDCRYNPDILAICDGQLVAFEVKGFMREDALVKLKTTARAFPWLRIVVVKRIKGEWIEEEVKP